ncbi:MAG: hypothetical protein S4CHLAM2_12420 [Chlamydiales bacterium]|nr:hypothetical protein [Chlamydiales bacterium]
MRLIFALILLLTSSCGYRFGRGEILEQYSSVCIPYVEGDGEGLLTAALIRSMTTGGGLAYRSYGADLQLKVCLMEPVDTNIGFAYAPRDPGDQEFSDIVVSNEARLTMTAVIRLIDRRTGCLVLGPCEVTSSLTYDFEPDLGKADVQDFSLGQLVMHNLAIDGATPPLYTLLSNKIVDFINHSW